MSGFSNLLHLGYDFSVAQCATYERHLISLYTEQWQAVRKELISLYAKGGISPGSLRKYNRLVVIEKDIRDIMNYYAQASQNVQIASFGDAVSFGYYTTSYAMEAWNPIAMRFGIIDPKSVEAAIANPYSGYGLVKTLKIGHENEIVKVWRAAAGGLLRGASYQRTANAVKDVFERSSMPAALRVIRTESHRALVIGQRESFDIAEDAGVDGKRFWMATLDARTRENHRSMDGQVEDIDGMFTLPDGDKTYGPGLSGIASEDIACRCRLGYSIPGLEADVRRARNPLTGKNEVVTYADYPEWFKQFSDEASGRMKLGAKLLK